MSKDRALLPVASGAEIRAALKGLVRPFRVRAIAALLALVAGAAVSLVTAPLLGRIVDLVVDGQGPDAVTTPVLLLVVVAIAQGLLAVLGVALVARVGENMLADLRERFVERALGLPLQRIESAGAGDLTSRAGEDVALVGEAVREAVPDFARAALTIGLTLVGLAVLDWRFMVAALLAVPVQVVTARWYLRRSSPMYALQRRYAAAQQQQLLDTVGGVRTVRALGLADDHARRVRTRTEDVVATERRVVRLQTGFFGRLNVAEFIGVAGVLTAGFLLVRSGTASIGTASAAALYFINLFGPINAVLFLLDTAQSAAASLGRIVGVVNLPAAGTVDEPRTASDGSVRVKGLGHAYVEGHDVLDGVDLDVEPGTRVALVGASGAGKTTLATLVAGVHRPVRGAIEIGGVPLDAHDPERLRASVALVTQEVHVFAGPLADDLRLARADATDTELRAALDAVGATGWVYALPEGLATEVGGGGHTLTVVQAQHLALARLVLADPLVAVLDEATAEAGSAGARSVEAAAGRAVAGRTGRLVAHRLRQAAGADLVVVLEAGRVVEKGTHDELLAERGRYHGLWAAWTDSR